MSGTTVIIATDNHRACIVKAIKSAINQTVKPDCIIIVDDDSKDGTYETLSKFLGSKKVNVGEKTGWPPEFTKIIDGISVTIARKRRSGSADTKNIAMKISWDRTTENFAFLEADQWYKPTMVEKSLEALDKYSIVACVIGDYLENIDGREFRKYVPTFDIRGLELGCRYLPNCVVRKGVVAAGCGFEQQDQMRRWFARVSKIGLIYNIPEVLYCTPEYGE